MDFMLERDYVTHRRDYPTIPHDRDSETDSDLSPDMRVLPAETGKLKTFIPQTRSFPRRRWTRPLGGLPTGPEIREVLVTGGDPLLLSNAKMESILRKLSSISHVERIRIGTRTPVTLPQRITDSLVRVISRFHAPGKRELLIVTHFEHTYEITPQCMNAVQKFVRNGIKVYNQLVYTRYNSRKFEAAALRLKLCLIGVTPYYTFNTKGKEETDDYRAPIPRLLQEQQEEARLLPGSARTDEIVFNGAGTGQELPASRPAPGRHIAFCRTADGSMNFTPGRRSCRWRIPTSTKMCPYISICSA